MPNRIGHFETHLRDAIRTNLARRPVYVARAGLRARLLSLLLVLTERLCLPLARHFDRRAAPFNVQGIAVVENDFIDMQQIADADTAPAFSKVAPPAAHRQVKQLVRQYKRDGKAALASEDFQRICTLTADTLTAVQALEQQHQAHFAMTIHLLESIGYAALHAPAYIEQSRGEARPLCRSLVAVQLALADGGLLMDKLAQRCHARGAGILVNDVPAIPFLHECRATPNP